MVAHPDDESFGLGAILDRFVTTGARASVLCFTHGEASTLHGVVGDLREIRTTELAEAAALLGLDGITLRNEADGTLSDADPRRLADTVAAVATDTQADGLLVFDSTGVTGHPDHVAATAAALAAGRTLGLDVLAWTLPDDVAGHLNAEFGTAFAGRPADAASLRIRVDRQRQLQAIRAHPSQAVPGSVLWRRLELLGDTEQLTWLLRHHP